MKCKSLIILPLLSSLALCLDMQKEYFDSLNMEEMPLIKAVDQINKIHSNKSQGRSEFKILLDNPLNMNDPVSFTLNNVNLDLLMNILLSGTEYTYVVSDNFLIIQDSRNPLTNNEIANNIITRDSVCLIEVNPTVQAKLGSSGYGSSGSGFLCELNGAKFLITNIHVIESANSLSDISVKTRDNIGVKLTQGFVAQDRDLCIFRHEEDTRLKYLKLSKNISSFVDNDPLYLLGYPLGGGVIRKSDGTLSGLGASLIEINCSAFPGNSGGPVISTKSDEVIGLLTKGELVDDNIFTKLARDKLGNPFADDLRIFATRIDTVQSNSWTPLVWNTWKDHKIRLHEHENALVALHSLVSSNYQPGTLITNEDSLVRDKDLWRAYKKCARDYDSALSKKDNTALNRSLTSFMNSVEISFRPETGRRWVELEKPWKYEWFLSSKSGNIEFLVRDNIQKLYRVLHNDWLSMQKRWEVN